MIPNDFLIEFNFCLLCNSNETHNYSNTGSLSFNETNTVPDLGRDLWVALITKNPHEEPILKPNVKYVANMHGNEVRDHRWSSLLRLLSEFLLSQAVGRELMLQLIAHLLNNYNTDSYVKSLVDNTRIHIMPSMNPDGFENSVEGQCTGGQGR